MTNTLIFPHYDREDLFTHPTGVSIEDLIVQYERISGCKVHRLKDRDYILQEY